MSPDDRVRLRHMMDAARSALQFTSGHTREDLDLDQLLTFGLTHAIMIIGEAAARIGQVARAEVADVPWSQIVGMRNRLVHAYFDIDRDILWATVTTAIPELLTKLETWHEQTRASTDPQE
jgi:uncharacterized protein with HEPN domain